MPLGGSCTRYALAFWGVFAFLSCECGYAFLVQTLVASSGGASFFLLPRIVGDILSLAIDEDILATGGD